MTDMRPLRYFGATLNTLDAASDDQFDCVDYDESEQKTLDEAIELIERLQTEFEEQ